MISLSTEVYRRSNVVWQMQAFRFEKLMGTVPFSYCRKRCFSSITLHYRACELFTKTSTAIQLSVNVATYGCTVVS